MPLTPPLRPISDAELELLKLLWQSGSATVRDLHEQVQSQGTDWAYNTVQTLLRRLEEKGYVSSEKEGRAFRFSPLLSRDDVLSEQLDSLADRICEGAARPLMLTLVRNRRFSPQEIEQFRALLDELASDEPASDSDGKPEAGRGKRSKRSKR